MGRNGSTASAVEFRDHVRRYMGAMKHLEAESDRSAAIIVASFHEVTLEKLLLLTMTNPLTVLFDGAGPLATFSAKIDAAYAFGAIGPMAQRTLHMVRKIRNEFAHSFEELTFDAPQIRDRVLAITLVPGESQEPLGASETARERFVQRSSILLGMLAGAAWHQSPSLLDEMRSDTGE